MPNRCWALAIVLLLGVVSTALPAASRSARPANARYAIDIWETDDGLPQNSVIAMAQTRDGYLWLGTLNGLVRFDGLHFTVFDESNTPELNSSKIISLFEDRAGNLWVGTQTAGVVLVKDGQLTHLPIGQGGAERRLAAVCEDPKGAVWLYTANGELWRYEAGHYQAFLIDQGRPSACRSLIAEPAGPVWVGTDRSQSAIGPTADVSSLDLPVEQNLPMGRLDFLLASRAGGYWRLADGRVQKWRTNQLERDVGPYPWDSRLTRVTAACEDSQGNLVIGTRGAGVFWFDPQGQATCLSTNEGLSHNLVLSLQVDREGTLWVGTDGGGLNRVKRQIFTVLEESRNQTVQSLCEDEEGGLWIGFNTVEFNASGAAYLRNGVLQRFGPDQGLLNSSVWAVFADRSQQVWAGTYGGLYQLRDGRFQRTAGVVAVILAIHQDRQGQLWFGTPEGLMRKEKRGWRIFTTRDGLSANEVRTIADDAEGNLWVGTRGGGLNRLRDGQFIAFRKQPEGLPSDNIAALHVDPDGVLWVATDGGGLARLRDGRWTRYTTREGLVSNSLGYLLDDDAGYLWIGSNAGLMRVARQALNDFAEGRITSVPCRAYGKPDGLPTRECTSGSQPGAVRARDGTLWFPTIKGLTSVDPTQLHPNTNPPPVLIESVLVDDQPFSRLALGVKGPESVTIPAGRERLEIHYTSLNLGAPDRARFRYRLEDYESAWVEAGNTRVVRYPKLPPDDYRFRVIACNEDGVWNETGSSLAITVLPPFWQTGWFLTASALALLGTIVGSVHYVSTQRLKRQVERMKQREALEKERGRIARDLHDQLGASLTQIALLGELAESDKDAAAEVEAHAQQISKTARETTRVLDEIVWAVNPSNDTLEGLINYVCKYAQDYLTVAGLRCRLEVPAQLPATALPPEVRHNVFLAAKEALTNVVRHAQATEARLRLRLEPTAFTLEIEDNGRGVAGLNDPRAQTRNGLRNMRRRMEDLGGSFSIGPSPGRGAVVRLTVPLDNRRTSLN
jgi:ligand-binding sensor domain-containing protein/signal transduction histidine kinase